MGRFTFDPCAIEGLFLIHQKPLTDHRGHLTRLFCEDEFRQIGWRGPVAQSNLTLTRRRGSLRGLHYQHPPHSEIKVITCLRGKVFDVALDIRAESPSFLHWHGVVLSPENNSSFFIPQGFAHGFQTLSDDVELLYFHNAPHAPDAEGGVNAQDPALAIDWPLPLSDISPRDQSLPDTIDFKGVTL